MFKEKTVFVLGAGASFGYQYPLGSQLVNIINTNMEDKILVPFQEKSEGYFFNENDQKPYPFYWWGAENLYPHSKSIEKNKKVVIDGFPSRLYAGSVDICFAREIPIQLIKEFNDLKKALEYFSPVSIDAFIRDNPSFSKAGKTMIAYSLLKIENEKYLLRKSSGKNSWYPYLLNDLLSECAENPDKLLDNEISFITFNYDISLDIYLKNRLMEIELYKERIAKTYIEEKLKIHHVYGSLNRESDYGEFGNNGEVDTTGWCYRRFVESINISTNILTMYDERNGQGSPVNIQQYREILEEAKEIIFIGFGFDRDNMNQIGLPKSKDRWIEFMEGKSIKWLNYSGEMTALSKQFNEIGGIIESTADNVISAYQNDFKSSLY